MAEHIEPKAPLSTFDKPDAAPGVPMAHADGGPGLGTLEGVNDSAPDSSGRAVPNMPSDDAHQGPQVGPTPQAHQRPRWWLGALIVVVMGATGFYAWRWYALPRTEAPMELALPPGDAALLPDAVRVVTPAGGFAESPEADAPEAPPSETGAPAHPVAVPAGTQPGQVFRVKDAGIPSLRGRGRGDLLVRVEVEIPGKLDDLEAELFHRLAEHRGETVAPPSKGVFARLRSAFQ